MAETIPGGAAYDMTTKRWVNANGEPLTKEQIAEVEKLAEQHAEANAEAERNARMLDAQRDPTARAIAAALTGGAQPAAPAAPSVPRQPAKTG